MALVVGAGAGLGAALSREMVFGATWLVTGHDQFGHQGHAPSAHLPGPGIWFVLIVPALGGLIYGPLIYRFARQQQDTERDAAERRRAHSGTARRLR